MKYSANALKNKLDVRLQFLKKTKQNKSTFYVKTATQIGIVTRHQYGIFALVSQTSFREETIGGVAKCCLFSQATIYLYSFNTVLSLFDFLGEVKSLT